MQNASAQTPYHQHATAQALLEGHQFLSSATEKKREIFFSQSFVSSAPSRTAETRCFHHVYTPHPKTLLKPNQKTERSEWINHTYTGNDMKYTLSLSRLLICMLLQAQLILNSKGCDHPDVADAVLSLLCCRQGAGAQEDTGEGGVRLWETTLHRWCLVSPLESPVAYLCFASPHVKWKR